MVKRTVPDLADFIAEATGLPDSNLRTISRRLREAGYLSQYGHGRGAAAATARDGALILLVAAAEVPPLHAVAMGEALRACEIMEKTSWPDGLPLAESAIDEVAARIDGTVEIDHVQVVMDKSVSVWVVTEGGSVEYHLEADHPAVEKLMMALGKFRAIIQRRHEIPGQVLRDIGDWLRDAEA